MKHSMTQPRTWPMMLLPVSIAVLMTPAILLAASGSNGGGFDSVVRGIESRYHVHANRIPFMGLISGIAGMATHGGVHGLHVATVEEFHGPVDGTEFNALVEQRVGPGWQRMIRETSRDGEQTLIYVRAEGNHVGMLVVDLDGHELDVVQLSVNPDQLSTEIAKHQHSGRDSKDSEEQSSDSDLDAK